MSQTEPKHRRVYAALRHDILIGKYDEDEKFPSEGMLVRRFGVSRITVRQAMTDLKNEGFLEARSGSGTYLSALARHATGLIGLVIPDYSSSQFFRRLGDELGISALGAELRLIGNRVPAHSACFTHNFLLVAAGNAAVRALAERNAVNAPIQGTAADIIKLAMTAVDRRLREGGFRARMVLQIHDELLLEVPQEEIAPVRELLVREMEGVISLSVPLTVECNDGKTWLEAH